VIGREQSSVYKTQTAGSSFIRDAGDQIKFCVTACFLKVVNIIIFTEEIIN